MSNSDGPNMWKVIQGLNATPDANSPNEAMFLDGRTITDIKFKANVFIHHYARVSKLTMSRADRDSVPSADDESCAPLQMCKLLSTIKKIKHKGAAGPGNIPPSFQKSLHIQVILFTCSLSTYLEGCHNHFVTESWEIS